MLLTFLKLHRYLGIILSLVIVLWCASGIIMMYQQYPTLTSDEEISSLPTLSFTNCCVNLNEIDLSYDIDYVEIEMLSGSPVMRVSSYYDNYTIDLIEGSFVNEVSNEETVDVVTTFLNNNNLEYNESNITSEVIYSDQWTIFGTPISNPPYIKYKINNKEGTHLYISLITGQLAQVTDRRERIWATLGPVIHWIYPKIIRDNAKLWSNTIIVLTVLSAFLCFFGIYIAFKRIKLVSAININRFKNINYIHHLSGLFIGFLMLSWIISGFLSINPFGILESRSFHQEYYLNSESGLNKENISTLIKSIKENDLPKNTVKIYLSKINNNPYALTISDDLERNRLNIETLEKFDLQIDDLKLVATSIKNNINIENQGWLLNEDYFYYSHHNDRQFPVYKIEYSDGEIIYLDYQTAKINLIVDHNRKMYRWLFSGLHRFDFFKDIRRRPIWDIIMLPIQISLLLFAFTGIILAIKSFRRIIKKLTTN